MESHMEINEDVVTGGGRLGEGGTERRVVEGGEVGVTMDGRVVMVGGGGRVRDGGGGQDIETGAVNDERLREKSADMCVEVVKTVEEKGNTQRGEEGKEDSTNISSQCDDDGVGQDTRVDRTSGKS